jgi:hypothetical protein
MVLTSIDKRVARGYVVQTISKYHIADSECRSMFCKCRSSHARYAEKCSACGRRIRL